MLDTVVKLRKDDSRPRGAQVEVRVQSSPAAECRLKLWNREGRNPTALREHTGAGEAERRWSVGPSTTALDGCTLTWSVRLAPTGQPPPSHFQFRIRIVDGDTPLAGGEFFHSGPLDGFEERTGRMHFRGPGRLHAHTNFGGNKTWRSRLYRPANESELLDILERHAHGHIRPMGSRHSWSDAAASLDVSLDMARFDTVEPYTQGGETFVRVGAGCTLQKLLDELHARSECTLPTLGAIKRQTISGAISTGTHGSGMPSLSHFVVAVGAAAYDAEGKARIFEYRNGDELKAARCALGCMGILMWVELRTVPKYKVEENVVVLPKLEDLRQRCQDYPLTQFALFPYCWKYLLFERKDIGDPRLSLRERLMAWGCRLFNSVVVDRILHLAIKLTLLADSKAQKWLMKAVPHMVREYSRKDDAEHVLTLGHHYFRHEEMEIFVPESRRDEAEDLLRCATDIFAGEAHSLAPEIKAKLRNVDLYDELVRNRGSYTHHYPFAFRRLHPEETLISMGSDAREPYYAISVFTYHKPQRRQQYYTFCFWLARCMTSLVDARLHWGKYFPLGLSHVAHAYPNLELFQRLCRKTDSNGVFRNDYTERVLGLEA